MTLAKIFIKEFKKQFGCCRSSIVNVSSSSECIAIFSRTKRLNAKRIMRKYLEYLNGFSVIWVGDPKSLFFLILSLRHELILIVIEIKIFAHFYIATTFFVKNYQIIHPSSKLLLLSDDQITNDLIPTLENLVYWFPILCKTSDSPSKVFRQHDSTTTKLPITSNIKSTLQSKVIYIT